MSKDNKEVRDYRCGFCKHRFTQKVGKFEGSPPPGGKVRHVSSQVKCPNCGNFLKTWGDTQ